MVRTTWLMLLGVLLVLPGGPRAADKEPVDKKEPADKKPAGKGPVGTYKLVALLAEREIVVYLVKMDTKEDKWSVSTLANNPQALPKPSAVENARLTGDRFSFDLKLVVPRQGGGVATQVLNVEGLMPKDQGKTLLGSVRQPNNEVFLVRFEPTKLKQLDSFILAKESLAEQNNYKACLTVGT